MGLLKDLSLLCNKNYRYLKKSLDEIENYQFINMDLLRINDAFFWDISLFIQKFYRSGFLGSSAQFPVFGYTSKNITPQIFNITCISLTIFYSLRIGLNKIGLQSYDELKNVILKIFNTLDSSSLNNLINKWRIESSDKLDSLLYKQFEEFNVLTRDAKSAAEAKEIKERFINFTNETFLEYATR